MRCYPVYKASPQKGKGGMMGRLKNLCDCGRQYLDFNGVEACQAGNHGQPRTCPDCEASRRKLEAAEEMAKALNDIKVDIVLDRQEASYYKRLILVYKGWCKAALSSWEKAGKEKQP